MFLSVVPVESGSSASKVAQSRSAVRGYRGRREGVAAFRGRPPVHRCGERERPLELEWVLIYEGGDLWKTRLLPGRKCLTPLAKKGW